jgi:hypothetical protein
MSNLSDLSKPRERSIVEDGTMGVLLGPGMGESRTPERSGVGVRFFPELNALGVTGVGGSGKDLSARTLTILKAIINIVNPDRTKIASVVFFF